MDDQIVDIAVVGGGPAGLSAVLTACIRNKRVVLFEHLGFSTRLRTAAWVDNYLGMPHITGQDMMNVFVEQCRQFDPAIIEEKVMNIYPGDGEQTIMTTKQTIQARAVIIATGVSVASVLPGEKEFLGRGVSYCATCDGMFFKGKQVVVVGYGPSEEEEANFLAEVCGSVRYLPQYRGEYRSLDQTIEVVRDKPKEIRGSRAVEQLVGQQRNYPVDGIFLLRPTEPVENLIPGLDMEQNVIRVNRAMETNLPGILAAGDCSGKPFQVAKAVGEGQMAAFSAIRFLEQRKKS